ncbi:MAG: nucleotide sugar dehydrogenase [bacterium]
MASGKEKALFKRLKEKIQSREATLGVIGLGYVGLPLAVEMAKAGIKVYGIDVDEQKVRSINKGTSYVQDVPSSELRKMVKQGRLSATTDCRILKECDAIDICVPTPLRKTKDPDISYIVDAVERIRENMRRGQLIILESTTYPGTTEEVVLPRLSEKGFKVGKDFFLAFSPERVDPGNKKYTTVSIPKVVGGITKDCTRIACELYKICIKTVVPVSSSTVAEMVKLLENTFRSVNIGLVNEICLMCNRMNIDVWEVIEAAGTKPFGFLKHYPGPGLGGHCIPIDPFYLSWKARIAGFEPRFIELAGQINSSMPEYVISKVTDALNQKRKSVSGSRILVLGVAYKRDVSDTRESPAIEIIRMLMAKGARVIYYDPYVPSLKVDSAEIRSSKLTPGVIKKQDCVAIVTDHTSLNYGMIVRNADLIVDTRNVLKKFRLKKIWRI